MHACGVWRLIRFRVPAVKSSACAHYVCALCWPYSRRNPISLLVALDSNGEAGGELYQDDGVTPGAPYTLTRFSAEVSQFFNTAASCWVVGAASIRLS
jgi:hypothetical protein